jgi:glycosyltransferase involved in cell wall biosynthesis
VIKILAIMPVRNEEEIVYWAVEKLVRQGIDVLMLDNHSTDSSAAEALRAGARVKLWGNPHTFSEVEMNETVLREARESDADWIIFHCADEVFLSQSDESYRALIERMHASGYNCINHRTQQYVPLDDSFVKGDMEERFKYWVSEESLGFFGYQQERAFIRHDELSTPSHLHTIDFPGKRVADELGLRKHYPILGQTHGMRKLFVERFGRSVDNTFTQYKRYKDDPNFLFSPDDPRLHSDASPRRCKKTEPVGLLYPGGDDPSIEGEYGEARWLLEKLKSKTPFKLVRYGDGEVLCMDPAQKGRYLANHTFTPKLRDELLASLTFDPSITYTTQRVVKMNLWDKLLGYADPRIEWFDDASMGDAMRAGNFQKIVDALNQRTLMLVGPEYFKNADFLFTDIHLSIPDKETYDLVDRIEEAIRKNLTDDMVVLICAAMTAKVLVYRLRDTNATIIDCGSAFDPYLGENSRGWHKAWDFEKLVAVKRNKMEHFYEQLDGYAGFIELYADMVKRAKDGDHFVEVGSYLGKSAAFMAVEIINSGKKIKFDCVDRWEMFSGMEVGGFLRHKGCNSDDFYQLFLKAIFPVAHVVKPVRAPSVEAAKRYADGSLDFVFLDAEHTFDNCLADILAWLPKMKPDGVLAGDDYGYPTVQAAIKAAGINVTAVTSVKENEDGSHGVWWVRT